MKICIVFYHVQIKKPHRPRFYCQLYICNTNFYALAFQFRSLASVLPVRKKKVRKRMNQLWKKQGVIAFTNPEFDLCFHRHVALALGWKRLQLKHHDLSSI